ncbi:MAG TPA: hypothetical protein PKX74_19745 [Leptospiraceae bacterium]|jgi:hypothetical protein|nr:hypothetical protein [Leptospirales bacterium]HMY47721.1 hypothetical protein [Leptospiraceae bacterium]HMZ38431.1 hypothetical protein [Leptospiraceae bacterium]HNE22499.1 hypothetical protein [Leptospiraceae bacterium]HNL69641.1 hypothetical protein [Leptospiraceae bacterium]
MKEIAFAILLLQPMQTRAPGYFLMPALREGELTAFLKSPVMDRSVLAQIASARENEARAILIQRRGEIRAEICATPESERPAAIAAIRKTVEDEHALYKKEISNYEAYIYRRMEKEIDPAYREQAVAARKDAFVLQRDRSSLIEQSWMKMLSAKDVCEQTELFSEKINLPYYLALFHYQSIFPAEMRSRTLLSDTPR